MLPYHGSRITRTILALFFVLLAGYALFEARGLLYGPAIHIPVETMTTNDPYTVVKGRAERIIELRLNGKTITVTEQGDFEEPYLLARGSNRLIFEARDARGRTTEKILDIVYLPKADDSEYSPPPPASSTPL